MTTTTEDKLVCTDPAHERAAVKAVELRWVGPADDPDARCFACDKPLNLRAAGVVLYLYGLPVNRECLARLARTVDVVQQYNAAWDAVEAKPEDGLRALEIVRQVAQFHGTQLTMHTIEKATAVVHVMTGGTVVPRSSSSDDPWASGVVDKSPF